MNFWNFRTSRYETREVTSALLHRRKVYHLYKSRILVDFPYRIGRTKKWFTNDLKMDSIPNQVDNFYEILQCSFDNGLQPISSMGDQ